MPVLCTRICAYGDGGWCSSVYLSWDIRVAKLAVAKKAPSVSNLPIYLYLVLARSFRFTNFLAPCRFARDQSQNYGVFRLTIFPMEYICFSFLPFFPYLDEWVLLLHCVYIHARFCIYSLLGFFTITITVFVDRYGGAVVVWCDVM